MPRKKKPPVVPSGGAYGSRQAMEQLSAAAPTTPQPSGAGASAPAPPGADSMQAADAFPGINRPTLAGPTRYPGEPFTAGLPVGPGPGPSDTPDPFANPNLPPQLIVSLEMLATLPDASEATRNLVRRLRSRL